MKKFRMILAGALCAAIGLASPACSDDEPAGPDSPETPDQPAATVPASFAKGADVSWVTELEHKGYKFRTRKGQEMELMQLLRQECGVNSIRLRVWVNPADGWNGIDDVMVKARRAKAAGMRLMIDFHFSDTWADPGKQGIPAAWQGLDLAATNVKIAGHVTEMLTSLKREGIVPEWVQIGNETRSGMLWPLGELDNGTNFTSMVNAGYDAVKAVCPDAKVIVHCDNGDNLWLYNNLFGKLKAQGARYDMIGMSLYPAFGSWQKSVKACLDNIDVVKATYGKDIMICEVGYSHDYPAVADAMMTTLMAGCVARDVKGIFWWEPESPKDDGYDKGCFDANGAPTQALDCFTR